jgi:hypothetical protein
MFSLANSILKALRQRFLFTFVFMVLKNSLRGRPFAQLRFQAFLILDQTVQIKWLCFRLLSLCCFALTAIQLPCELLKLSAYLLLLLVA